MRNFKYTSITGLFILLFFCTGNFMAQNIMQGEPGQKIREMAKERTTMWVKELSLSAKQADLMERKIIEYTMKRTELMNSKMNEEAKVKRYMALQVEEEKDMRDILTGPQHEKYLRINRQSSQTENRSSQ